MEIIVLQTSEGKFVSRAYITPFKGTSQGIKWQGKCFQLHGIFQEKNQEPLKIYREVDSLSQDLIPVEAK